MKITLTCLLILFGQNKIKKKFILKEIKGDTKTLVEETHVEKVVQTKTQVKERLIEEEEEEPKKGY